MVDTTAADALATQGAKVSKAMLSVQFYRYILIPPPERISHWRANKIDGILRFIF